MTAQSPETLILDGEEMVMTFCPPLPEGHPRIYELSSEDFHRSIFNNSACWRGYEGTWEIRDGRFYLVSLVGRFQLLDGDPIFADWFSGVLRISQGNELLYVHMGFGSVYEEEIHIKIDKGIVVGTRIVDNRGKEYDEDAQAWRNLPGFENSFPGDDWP